MKSSKQLWKFGWVLAAGFIASSVVGCASAPEAPTARPARTLADVSAETMASAQGEPQFVEVSWQDQGPQKVERRALPQTRAVKSQLNLRSSKGRVFVTPTQ